MKKILSLIVITLFIWLIAIWYAGNQTEKLLNQLIIKENQLSQQKQLGYEVELTKFDSNLFNAEAQYSLKFDSSEFSGQPPFLIDYDIQYGPIFLDGGLNFGIAKISYHSSLNKLLSHFQTADIQDETLKLLILNLNQALNKEVMINFTSFLSFFGEIRSNGVIGEIQINNNDLLLTIDRITFNGVSNVDNLIGQGNLNIPNLAFKDVNNLINIQDFSVDYKVIDVLNDFGFITVKGKKVSTVSSDNKKTNFSFEATSETKKHQIANLSNYKAVVKIEVLDSMSESDSLKTMQLSFLFNGINHSKLLELFSKNNFTTLGASKKTEKKDYFINNANKAILDEIFIKQVTNIGVNADITTAEYPKIHNTANLKIIYNAGRGDLSKFLVMVNDKKYLETIQFIQNKLIANLKLKVYAEIARPFESQLKALSQQDMIINKDNFYQTYIEYRDNALWSNGKSITQFMKQVSGQ